MNQALLLHCNYSLIFLINNRKNMKVREGWCYTKNQYCQYAKKDSLLKQVQQLYTTRSEDEQYLITQIHDYNQHAAQLSMSHFTRWLYDIAAVLMIVRLINQHVHNKYVSEATKEVFWIVIYNQELSFLFAYQYFRWINSSLIFQFLRKETFYCSP